MRCASTATVTPAMISTHAGKDHHSNSARFGRIMIAIAPFPLMWPPVLSANNPNVIAQQKGPNTRHMHGKDATFFSLKLGK